MREIFVLHDKNTGEIKGGSGRVDRELDETRRDGSTVLEYIERQLSGNPDLTVTYFPVGQELPDSEKKKVLNGKILDIPKQDIEKKATREQLILARMRKMAEDQLKAEGKIE